MSEVTGSLTCTGANKAYDSRDFIGHRRPVGVTPHVA